MDLDHRRNEAEVRRLEALGLAMASIVPYLDDDSIIEIILNADGAIWIERMGAGMSPTDVRMDPADAFRMIQLVASMTSTEVTNDKPSLAALVPGWGARLQAMVPPVVAAPVFTIRKPPKQIFSLADYVGRGIMSGTQAGLIKDAVQGRANILVGGSTGSGKTTLANAILHEIASATQDRLYIVEDLREPPVCIAPTSCSSSCSHRATPGSGRSWMRCARVLTASWSARSVTAPPPWSSARPGTRVILEV